MSFRGAAKKSGKPPISGKLIVRLFVGLHSCFRKRVAMSFCGQCGGSLPRGSKEKCSFICSTGGRSGAVTKGLHNCFQTRVVMSF